MGGSSTVPGSDEGQSGVYGTLGTPAAANIPGGRGAAAVWTDHSGNTWLFGGYGFDANGSVSYLNDLWELNPATNEWTWMSGSSTIGSSGGQPGVYGTLGTPAAGNVPGGRAVPSSWTDSSGNLWLFGGYGYDSVGALSTLNDVWEFSPSSKEWTWMGGSSTIGSNYGQSGVYGTLGTPAAANIPGSRYFSTGWTDSSGHFWLFGGYGFGGNGNYGYLNDLWEFNPSMNEWTWMGGSSTIATDNSGPSGVYGTLRETAAGNWPGGRGYSASWIDSSDNVWLFGGGGFDADGDFGYLNDLWELNSSMNEWTWMGGSSTVGSNCVVVNGVSSCGQPGVYGTLEMPATGHTPGGRETAIGWTESSGNLWLFGGSGFDANGSFGSLGDLWQFSPSTNEWTWMGGSSTPGDIGQPGVYGTLGKPAAGNFPGSRYYVASWADSSGDFWLFGGLGQDANNTGGSLNDLWKFQPAGALTSPAPGSTFTGSSVTFTWTPGTGVTDYQLWLGTTGVGSQNLYNSGKTKATSVTVSGLPTYGVTVYARLWSEISGVWLFADYTYTESGTPVPPVLTTPAPGSVLSGSSVTFTWTAGGGPASYQLWLGTTGVGSQNLYDSGATTATTETVSGLPANGAPVYARLWWEIDAAWQSADYIYFEAGTPVPPALITPVPGRILSGSTVAFAWTPSAGVTDYQLWLGSTRVGAQNLYDSGATKATTVTVSGLPTNGVTVYARLWWEVSGVWTSADYTYTEAGTPVLPVLTTPAPGSVLSGSSVAFTWTAGTGPVAYQLYLGTTGVGSHNLYESGSTTATTVTVNNVPTYGLTVYARLWWEIDAAWKSADYTYTEAGAPVSPVLTTPAPGSVLPGSSVAFTWTAGGGPSAYQLYLGTTGVGSHNLYESGATAATTVTVSTLPTAGVTVYARLWWLIGATWSSADYTYTEAGTPVLPVLTTPAPGSTLAGSSVAFTWTAGAGPAAYQLYVGTTGVGSHNLYESGATTATTVTVSDLPTTGVPVYVRLWWEIDAVWKSADYTYTAQ
jgi:N-acetylneuraminic acid mutarotase